MHGMSPIEVLHDGETLRGSVALPDGDGPFPAVLVMHNALGLGDQVYEAARLLAAHGFLAVATNMYGVDAPSEDAAGKAFQALLENPQRLRDRTVKWREAVAARSDVDTANMAAIGYCFGGRCVLELARSGSAVKAVISYHGLLTTDAPAAPGSIQARVVAYCGGKDPYAPTADIDGLREEMETAQARYQITIFGDAEHSFTDPNAGKMGRPGISYNAVADKVSWAGTLALLDEALKA